MEQKIYRQRINQEKDIKAVADGYASKIVHELWLADGLQKDAIQNSWDARSDKKHGKNWECGFSLLKVGNKDILCISDQGTLGLNGTKFSDEASLGKILNDNNSGEDLACFLNSNWSAKSTEEGGNRGRGKTLFLFTSQDKKVLFDSLRSSDNSYVFGELYLDTSEKQVKFSVNYDEAGKEKLRNELDEGISPINQYGTRIFVLNPDKHIVNAIRSGEFLSFINNSRWETLKKYDAKIFVDDGSGKKYATLPYWYQDDRKDIPGKDYKLEVIKEGSEYRIKRLILRYAPNLKPPDALKGIAIQRGGMTIERIPVDALLHEEGATDIYGWVEMENKPLEEEMKKLCEGPEHFDFTWTQKPAKQLRDYLRTRARDFAKEFKILESAQARKNQIQKAAEKKALELLTPLFKRLGLSGGHGKNRKAREQESRKQNEPLRLSMPDIKFPRDVKRVNYGEKIEGTYVVPINEFGESISVLVRVFIVSADGKTEMLQEKEINLRDGKGPIIGAQEIAVSKKYKAGEYHLRARMLSLEEKGKILPDGTKIEKGVILYDRINYRFYVETDPPESGPFKFQPKPKDDKKYIFECEPDAEDGGYIIYYNNLHPRIKILLDQEENLTNYLTEQGALLSLQVKLEELMAEDNQKDKEFTKLVTGKDLSSVYKFFLARHSEFLWDLER